MAASEGRFEEEGWRLRKDGSRFWANVIVTPLRDAAGELQGFAKVTRDFTERKRAEEALLLEITNVLVSNLDIRRLLAAISASIHQVARHDYASLALYDPEIKRLRVQVLDSPGDVKLNAGELLAPLEGTPAGEAFSTRQPMVLDRIDTTTIRSLFNLQVVAEESPEEIRRRRLAARRRGSMQFTGPNQGAAAAGEEAGKIKTVVRSEPKVGRNDPCPCGSGKKYKKCHGAAV